jgi:hypothetical protein
MDTFLWTASGTMRKHEVAEGVQRGPDVKLLGGAALALMVDPEVLRNTVDLHTALATLTQAVLSGAAFPDVEELPEGPFLAGLKAARTSRAK